ncbi:uncharacterized protein, partial [Triticum aestivum]|uniref:uncharacterized protein n=1 Tax=Triticum aestivum TaxID=4565 RepID=UPI001D021144
KFRHRCQVWVAWLPICRPHQGQARQTAALRGSSTATPRWTSKAAATSPPRKQQNERDTCFTAYHYHRGERRPAAAGDSTGFTHSRPSGSLSEETICRSCARYPNPNDIQQFKCCTRDNKTEESSGHSRSGFFAAMASSDAVVN